MQLLLLSCWVLTRCFHFGGVYAVMTYVWVIFHGQTPPFSVCHFSTSPSDLQWVIAMHSAHRASGEQRSDVIMLLLINLWFPEASGSCCSWALHQRLAQTFDDKARLSTVEVCLYVCVCVAERKQNAFELSLWCADHRGGKTVAREKRGAGYCHCIWFRGG